MLACSLCHLYSLCSPHASLLAWHVELLVMKVTSVQVCSESTSHAEAAQKTYDPQQVQHGKLLFSKYISLLPPAELAMMSTHRRAAAGETLSCCYSSCLYALDLINMAESVITHCQAVAESDW